MGQRCGIATSIPLPVPDELSTPFWEAAAEHILVMQKCESCGWFAYPPVRFCGNCLAPAGRFSWEPVSGRGRVKTWTVMHQAFLPGFDDAVPYVVGDVELAEQSGLRMVARLVGIDADTLRVGLDVEVAFVDLAAGQALPVFGMRG